VDAQQAPRVLDRMWVTTMRRCLGQSDARLSDGRVQKRRAGLIVERELEIRVVHSAGVLFIQRHVEAGEPRCDAKLSTYKGEETLRFTTRKGGRCWLRGTSRWEVGPVTQKEKAP